ncbi:hypothetical protein ACWWD9_05790 [Methylovorus sp. SPW-M1]
MYIVAIAWLYVTVLMAATEPSLVAGILTFMFYGLLPCALLLWLFGTPQRRRRKQAQEKAALLQEKLGQPDRGNAKHDQ